jgi:drug/metabolite transporter (DMT)-like permease
VTTARPQRPFLAGLWMMGALVFLCGMAISGRELSAELTAFQTSMIRSLTCLLFLLALLAVIGFRRVRTARVKQHVTRNVIHFTAQTSWLYGVAVLPLAEVFAIEFTAPIWTAVLAMLLLKEKMTGNRLWAILLGFAGILIILRPGAAVINPASFVVLFAALGFASTYVFTRHMSATESPLTVVFYMNLIQLPLGLAASIPGWTVPSLEMWPWILMIGVSGLGSHFCFAHAFSHADATVVSPLDFLRLPFIAVIGYAFYQEPWDLMILLGGVVIFSGNLINLWGERKVKPKPDAEPGAPA